MSTTPDYRRLMALRQLAQQADAIITSLPDSPTVTRLVYVSADLLYLIDVLETFVRHQLPEPQPNHGPWKRERVLIVGEGK